MFVITETSDQILPEIQHFSKVDDLIPIQPNFEDFWKLKTVGITPSDRTKEDDKSVMGHYENAVDKVNRRY